MPPRFHLSGDKEKSEYDKHQNSPDDLGYRQFLSRMHRPLLSCLSPGDKGLDFGCGPGPTLSLMFQESGYPTAVYDLYYFPDKKVLSEQYDFVTATEVVEHLREPAITLKLLWSCVAPGGALGVMTKLVKNRDAFSTWHYKNDKTHIAFYSQVTLEWLADIWQAELKVYSADAFIFYKK